MYIESTAFVFKCVESLMYLYTLLVWDVLACSYIIEDGICYLAITERAYPRKLVFAYLADVHKDFVTELQRDNGDQCVS
jgi:hypothetical protein